MDGNCSKAQSERACSVDNVRRRLENATKGAVSSRPDLGEVADHARSPGLMLKLKTILIVTMKRDSVEMVQQHVDPVRELA